MSSKPATHYDLLKVSHRARPEGVRAAYRRLAQKYHPDKNHGNADAERIMAALNEAYAVLSDPERRVRYDRVIADSRMRSREARNRRFAEVQQADAAWPWWLLFATISFCTAAVGVSIYKGYVPGAARASTPAATAQVAAAAAPRPGARLSSN